jgi:predicted AlkP superfamily pyrophosphatase or phosphodiesterase
MALTNNVCGSSAAVIPILLGVFFSLTALPVQAQPRRDSHVVVISLDGFSAQALQNPHLPLPNLRKLMAEGAYSAAMVPINPTVTWPNHTAIVTGVDASIHGVLYNGLPVRKDSGIEIDEAVDKANLVHATTVYDLAFRAGLTTAEVDWVAIQNPGTITWSFAEEPSGEGAVDRELVTAGVLSADQMRAFAKLPITERDEHWQNAAIQILKTHKPHLMLLHFLTTDSVQHSYAPNTLAADTALALADQRVGRVLQAIREIGIEKSTTLIVVSDHGFKTVRKLIHPRTILRNQGSDVFVVPEGGTAMVYIMNRAKRTELLHSLPQQFAAMKGVARVLTAAQFSEFGYPAPEKNQGMADLVLAASDGYAFDGKSDGEPVTDSIPPVGSHGYLNTDADMNAIFIAWGAGIRKGIRLPEIRNVDVAPTIARLLGIEMSGVSGHTLANVLE